MNRFRKALATKRRKAAVIVALLALIPMGVFAYFASHPNANSFNNTPVQLGSTPAAELVNVTIGPQTGNVSPYLTPGASVTFPVMLSLGNLNPNPVDVASVAATVTQNGSGDIYDDTTHAYITGCKAPWFTASTNFAGPVTIQPGGTNGTTTLTVAMSSPAGVDQSVCEGAAPDVVVTAS